MPNAPIFWRFASIAAALSISPPRMKVDNHHAVFHFVERRFVQHIVVFREGNAACDDVRLGIKAARPNPHTCRRFFPLRVAKWIVSQQVHAETL